MTATYSSDPANSNNDAVRFEMGDTDVDNRPLLQDEEIAYALSKESNHILRTCVRLAEGVAARFARKDTVGGAGVLTYTKSQLYSHYKDLAQKFRNRIGSGVTTLQTSQAAIDLLKKDTDLPKPQFKRGLHDNDGTSTVDEKTTPV